MQALGMLAYQETSRRGDKALGDDEVSCEMGAKVLSTMYQRANSCEVTMQLSGGRVSVQWKMTLVVSHRPGLSHTGQTQNGLGYKGEWMLAIGV